MATSKAKTASTPRRAGKLGRVRADHLFFIAAASRRTVMGSMIPHNPGDINRPSASLTIELM